MQQAELHGYKDGKMQAKYISRVFKVKLADGSLWKNVVIEETDFTFAVGSKRRMEAKSSVLVHADMTLAESNISRDNNGVTMDIVTKVSAGQIIQNYRGDELAEPTEKNMSISEPVYYVHPLLFTRELTTPGQAKTYHTFNDTSFQVQDLQVIYKGQVDLNENGRGRAFWCRHYQVENSSNPGAFQDYYVDAAGKPLKIVYPEMEFRFYR